MRILFCSLVLTLGLGSITFAACGEPEATTKPACKDGSCGEKAVKKDDASQHACCVQAAKEGKVCEKCSKKAS